MILNIMTAEEKKLGEWKEVGEITHYFPHPEAAVVKLSGTLKQGEAIRIVGGVDTDFEQKVTSMEFDHEKIKQAGKGDEIGLRVKEKVREGYKVYRQ